MSLGSVNPFAPRHLHLKAGSGRGGGAGSVGDIGGLVVGTSAASSSSGTVSQRRSTSSVTARVSAADVGSRIPGRSGSVPCVSSVRAARRASNPLGRQSIAQQSPAQSANLNSLRSDSSDSSRALVEDGPSSVVPVPPVHETKVMPVGIERDDISSPSPNTPDFGQTLCSSVITVSGADEGEEWSCWQTGDDSIDVAPRFGTRESFIDESGERGIAAKERVDSKQRAGALISGALAAAAGGREAAQSAENAEAAEAACARQSLVELISASTELETLRFSLSESREASAMSTKAVRMLRGEVGDARHELACVEARLEDSEEKLSEAVVHQELSREASLCASELSALSEAEAVQHSERQLAAVIAESRCSEAELRENHYEALQGAEKREERVSERLERQLFVLEGRHNEESSALGAVRDECDRLERFAAHETDASEKAMAVEMSLRNQIEEHVSGLRAWEADARSATEREQRASLEVSDALSKLASECASHDEASIWKSKYAQVEPTLAMLQTELLEAREGESKACTSRGDARRELADMRGELARVRASESQAGNARASFARELSEAHGKLTQARFAEASAGKDKASLAKVQSELIAVHEELAEAAHRAEAAEKAVHHTELEAELDTNARISQLTEKFQAHKHNSVTLIEVRAREDTEEQNAREARCLSELRGELYAARTMHEQNHADATHVDTKDLACFEELRSSSSGELHDRLADSEFRCMEVDAAREDARRHEISLGTLLEAKAFRLNAAEEQVAEFEMRMSELTQSATRSERRVLTEEARARAGARKVARLEVELRRARRDTIKARREATRRERRASKISRPPPAHCVRPRERGGFNGSEREIDVATAAPVVVDTLETIPLTTLDGSRIDDPGAREEYQFGRWTADMTSSAQRRSIPEFAHPSAERYAQPSAVSDGCQIPETNVGISSLSSEQNTTRFTQLRENHQELLEPGGVSGRGLPRARICGNTMAVSTDAGFPSAAFQERPMPNRDCESNTAGPLISGVAPVLSSDFQPEAVGATHNQLHMVMDCDRNSSLKAFSTPQQRSKPCIPPLPLCNLPPRYAEEPAFPVGISEPVDLNIIGAHSNSKPIVFETSPTETCSSSTGIPTSIAAVLDGNLFSATAAMRAELGMSDLVGFSVASEHGTPAVSDVSWPGSQAAIAVPFAESIKSNDYEDAVSSAMVDAAGEAERVLRDLARLRSTLACKSGDCDRPFISGSDDGRKGLSVSSSQPAPGDALDLEIDGVHTSASALLSTSLRQQDAVRTSNWGRPVCPHFASTLGGVEMFARRGTGSDVMFIGADDDGIRLSSSSSLSSLAGADVARWAAAAIPRSAHTLSQPATHLEVASTSNPTAPCRSVPHLRADACKDNLAYKADKPQDSPSSSASIFEPGCHPRMAGNLPLLHRHNSAHPSIHCQVPASHVAAIRAPLISSGAHAATDNDALSSGACRSGWPLPWGPPPASGVVKTLPPNAVTGAFSGTAFNSAACNGHPRSRSSSPAGSPSDLSVTVPLSKSGYRKHKLAAVVPPRMQQEFGTLLIDRRSGECRHRGSFLETDEALFDESFGGPRSTDIPRLG